MDAADGRTAAVAIIGCGNIADRYVQGMRRFPNLNLVGCADVIPELADELATQSGIKPYASIDELLTDPRVDLIVNLTPPHAHASVAISALDAGKHVYVEKPIATTLAESHAIFTAAKRSGKRIGSAPDTFLGSAGATARAAIDNGQIGDPIAATIFVQHSKAELWHPDPTFLFQPGGGPALDLGPYYITTLVNMLGPVRSVAGFTRIGAETRKVTTPNRKVDTIRVTTPTHYSATLRLVSGVIVTLMMSFDVWDSELPYLEIYGQDGTMTLPDPNTFDGAVKVHRHDDESWCALNPVISPTGPANDMEIQMLRGIGVADLVGALNGGPHRASGALAQHVLEVLEAIETSSTTESVVTVSTKPDRPAVQHLKESDA